MLCALAIEGLSSVLEVSRSNIQMLFDKIESRVDAISGDLDRRIGAALSSSDDDSYRAEAIAGVGASIADKEIMGLVLSVAGTAWGVSIAHAGFMAVGASVAVAGFSMAPVVAFILGLIIMVVCGKYCFSVIKKMLNKITEFQLEE